MRKFLCALGVALLLVGSALAGQEEDELTEALRLAWPEWQVLIAPEDDWRISRETGLEEDVVTALLYRADDGAIRLRQLTAYADLVWSGASFDWEIADWAPIPATEDAVLRLASPPRSWRYAAAAFVLYEPSELEGCASFLIREGERLTDLYVYADSLVGIVADENDLCGLRIAEWNGAEYTSVAVSPMSKAALWIPPMHSTAGFLEFFSDAADQFSLARGADGLWRLETVLGQGAAYSVMPDALENLTLGGATTHNQDWFYGTFGFPVLLTELDFSAIPSPREAIGLLNRDGMACTACDGTVMYGAPDGQAAAVCYARLAGRVTGEQGEWTQLCFGQEPHSLTGWFRTADLAFGAEMDRVRCGFPQFDDEDMSADYLMQVLPGLELPPDGYFLHVWLVGRLPDQRWLVELNGAQIWAAPEDAFHEVGSNQELEGYLDDLSLELEEYPDPLWSSSFHCEEEDD